MQPIVHDFKENIDLLYNTGVMKMQLKNDKSAPAPGNALSSAYHNRSLKLHISPD